MKKRITLALLITLIIAAGTAIAASACERPPAPVCPEGQITVEEAEWVEGHMACPAGYTPHYGMCRKKVCWGEMCWWKYALKRWVPGHWTDPVCRGPKVGCMDPLAANYDPDAEAMGACEYCEWEYVRTQCVDYMEDPPGTMRNECYPYSTDHHPPKFPDVANRVCTLCVDGEILEFKADYRIGCSDVEVNSCTGEVRFFYPGWDKSWINIWNDKAPCVTDDC